MDPEVNLREQLARDGVSSGHTSGPWVAGPNRGLMGIEITAQVEGLQRLICGVRSGADAAANATLIEAAPDLLAERDALRALIEKLEGVLSAHGFRRCDIPVCNCGSWHVSREGQTPTAVFHAAIGRGEEPKP